MAPLTPPTQRPIKLLIVEGERDGTGVRPAFPHAHGGRIDVESAAELCEGLKRLSDGGIDVVLLDLTLPDSEGMATFERMYAFCPDVPIVVLTEEYDEDLGVSAVQAGAQDYLVKAEAEPAMVLRALRYALERHRLQAALRSLSLVDDLTGLYNLRGFAHLAEQHFEHQRRSRRGVALVCVDLDHLKTINDSLGHHVGDRALRRVADILRATFRRSDVVARIGGDEFAVLALEATDEGFPGVLGRLRGNVSDFNDSNREPYQISLSVGTARYDGARRVSLEQLVGEADRSMREEKRAKLNAVVR